MLQNQRGLLDLRGLALVSGAIAWLAGIILDAWTMPPTPVLLGGAALALACTLVFWRNNRGRLIALLAFLFLLGAWRYALASPVGDHTAINAFIGAKKLEMTGSVTDEPTLQARSRLLHVAVNSVSLDNGLTWQNAHGLVDVQLLGNTFDDPYGPHYGDDVQLQGNLQPPPPNSNPDIFASMSFPRISINQSGGNPFIAALYRLRFYLATIISRTLPQPMAALLIALVLSLRTPALKPLIQLFNVTGTAHLIAPSGFKVTILAGLVADHARWLSGARRDQTQRLLPAEKRRSNRRQMLATGLVILCITGYTFLSGGSPAAVRAGIMGILLALAPRFGRVYNVYNSLALTVLLMSMFDPFVLWDAGFQLSLFGTLGIILFTPLLMRPLHRLARIPFGHYFIEIMVVTLSAEIATLPIFAITFHQLSLIALVTNILTVPLLAMLIMLGLLVCAAGAVWLPAGMLCGWIVWPLLWYVIHGVSWCAALPGAYLSVNNLTTGVAWGYYAALVVIAGMLLRRWPPPQQSSLLQTTPTPALLSKRAWRLLQLGAALVIILATATTAIAARSSNQLTITFLNVGPANQPAQGEAILIRTPDGKTALIDGGLDATSLASELDTRLPFWQRSLDMVILTAPRQDELVGLEDIVSRYQVGEAIDAGMLHPNTGYALYRRTISERNIPYVQLRQGATIALGTQVAIQVFWPTSPLHKGATEVQDNGLILRLVAPGLRLLLLGAAALSKYALAGVLATINHSYLAADVAQVIGEAGKTFPANLQAVLQAAHPSLVIISPASLSAKLRKTGASSTLTSLQSISGAWQIAQTAQLNTIQISSDEHGWTMLPDA